MLALWDIIASICVVVVFSCLTAWHINVVWHIQSHFYLASWDCSSKSAVNHLSDDAFCMDIVLEQNFLLKTTLELNAVVASSVAAQIVLFLFIILYYIYYFWLLLNKRIEKSKQCIKSFSTFILSCLCNLHYLLLNICCSLSLQYSSI